MKLRAPTATVAAVALVLVLGLVVASCGGGGLYGGATTSAGAAGTATTATGGESAQVSLRDLAIVPTSVTLKAGGSVTWSNDDSFVHHLVGDKGEFDSGDIAPGASFTFTFKTPGVVAYHCSIHPEMIGTVTVR